MIHEGLKNDRKGFKTEPKKFHGSVSLKACDNIGHNTSRLALLLAKPKRKYVVLLCLGGRSLPEAYGSCRVCVCEVL